MINNNKKIIFDLPEDITIINVIDEILKNNGLAESAQEFLDRDDNNEEPRLIIVRDAALTMAEKKVPENKITELLQEHLKTSKETAEKIVNDINQKLIPYAKIIDLEITKQATDQKENFQEELLNKIKSINASTPKPEEVKEEKTPTPYDKKPEITDVEKNAEKIKQERKPIVTQNPVINKPIEEKINTQNIKPDKYKEPIE